MIKMSDPTNEFTILQSHLSSIGNVREWATYEGYKSTGAFRHRILKLTGKNPKVVLNEVRLKRAKQMLLASEEYSCYEIARHIGLDDELSFSKFFRYHVGVSPRKYKALYKK